jgi:Transposase
VSKGELSPVDHAEERQSDAQWSFCTPACRGSSAGRRCAGRGNILTYFQHRVTNATAEGLNSKIQMVKEMACGFRNREHYKTAIYFHCGGLDLYPRLEALA